MDDRLRLVYVGPVNRVADRSPSQNSRAIRCVSLLSLSLPLGASLLGQGTLAQAQQTNSSSSAAVPPPPPAIPSSAAPLPSASASGAPAAETLQQAKDLFRKATELLQTGDAARALELYLQSRALVPSVPNTLNAAICLERLDRTDEALEMYEELLGRFGRDLNDPTRQSVVTAMSLLRRSLGAIDLACNVDGTVVVDGRMRGKLPLVAPLRAKPGPHVVRILKDGYGTYETQVKVVVGSTTMIDARLEPLAAAGRLRLEAPSLEGAEVFVDGALLGIVPWEGTLAPGLHLLMLRKGDLGAGPLAARVVQGQTVTLQPTLAELSGEVSIVVDPVSASLSIDGVVVGTGAWRGRLTRAKHRVEASETGYVSVSQEGLPESRRLVLRADPTHPRWAKAGHFWVEGFGGIALTGSLGSGAETWCDAQGCTGETLVRGPIGGLRAGYAFRFGGALELGAGYLWLTTSMNRSYSDSFVASPQQASEQPTTVPVTWNLEQTIRLAGPWVALGAHYDVAFKSGLFLRGRLDGALWFARVRNGVTGTVRASGPTKGVETEGSAESASSNVFLVVPEIAAGWRWGSLSLAAGLSLGIALNQGPESKLGESRVGDAHCVTAPGSPSYDPLSVNCAPNRALVSQERTHDHFLLWIPNASFRYAF